VLLFGVQFERRKVDKKSKPTWKLKHANSILESFEYFCQKSSKSIATILSYTVSKLVHFLRHSVEAAILEQAVEGAVATEPETEEEAEMEEVERYHWTIEERR